MAGRGPMVFLFFPYVPRFVLPRAGHGLSFKKWRWRVTDIEEVYLSDGPYPLPTGP